MYYVLQTDLNKSPSIANRKSLMVSLREIDTYRRHNLELGRPYSRMQWQVEVYSQAWQAGVFRALRPWSIVLCPGMRFAYPPAGLV